MRIFLVMVRVAHVVFSTLYEDLCDLATGNREKPAFYAGSTGFFARKQCCHGRAFCLGLELRGKENGVTM